MDDKNLERYCLHTCTEHLYEWASFISEHHQSRKLIDQDLYLKKCERIAENTGLNLESFLSEVYSFGMESNQNWITRSITLILGLDRFLKNSLDALASQSNSFTLNFVTSEQGDYSIFYQPVQDTEILLRSGIRGIFKAASRIFDGIHFTVKHSSTDKGSMHFIEFNKFKN